MKTPLVSIIIPTYNRAHLIGETLDSIVTQTYTNWECIVVDDGSTDGTDEVLDKYCKKDKRFQYHHRPKDRLKGGNAARNHGFELSKGDYIQWFDSDDMMHPKKLQSKVKAFQEYKVDFVISKSKILNSEEIFYHYKYTSDEINFDSFAIGNVSWVTDDFIVRRKLASNINFNESLKAGQEYNYCCKLLLYSEKGYFLDEFLTYRRIDGDSIGNNRRSNRSKYLKSRFEMYWLNYLEVSKLVKHKKFEKHTLLICISCFLRNEKAIKLPTYFYNEIFKVFGLKGFYFVIAKWSKNIFGKYFYFYNKLK